MIAVDETPSTGPGGLQDPVSFGVGDTVSAEHPRARDSGISQEGPPGSAGISPRLVSGGDWGGTGPCPSTHGDSTKVRGLKGGGDLEKRHQSAAEREIPEHVAQSVLGLWRDGHEGFSPPRWASTKRPFGSMCGTRASRRRVKRSLNCEETPPVRTRRKSAKSNR